jgi:hypothetical protein
LVIIKPNPNPAIMDSEIFFIRPGVLWIYIACGFL